MFFLQSQGLSTGHPSVILPSDGVPISNPLKRTSLNAVLDLHLSFLSAKCSPQLSSNMATTCTPSKYKDNITCYENCSVRFFYEQVNKTISFDWRTRDTLVVTLGLTVSFIVIFSNILVITSILKNRRFHYPIYYLLGNLALADFFAGNLVLLIYFCVIIEIICNYPAMIRHRLKNKLRLL